MQSWQPTFRLPGKFENVCNVKGMFSKVKSILERLIFFLSRISWNMNSFTKGSYQEKEQGEEK